MADQSSTAPSSPSTPVVSDPGPDVVPPSDGPFPVAADAMASTLATLLQGTVSNPSDDQYHLAAPDGWQSGAVDLNGAIRVGVLPALDRPAL